MRYDEADLELRLGRLSRARRTAFAASCAERLWPLFAQCADATGQGDVAVLGPVLDTVWSAVRGEEADLTGAEALAGTMVPSEDGEWVHELGYGQNSAACVAYAVATWTGDSARHAAWAARQVYEAADYGAQRLVSAFSTYTPDVELSLRQHPVVREALTAIAADLDAVSAPVAPDWEGLRERARREGTLWARSLP